MEKLLAEILAEMKYQTKLLENIFDTKRANGGPPSIEDIMRTATEIMLKMPGLQHIDQNKIRAAILGNNGE